MVHGEAGTQRYLLFWGSHDIENNSLTQIEVLGRNLKPAAQRYEKERERFSTLKILVKLPQ
jgi:hypothetical protein